MSFERKDGGSTSANNNGYPSTAYGPTDPNEVGVKGLLQGASSNKGEYDAEYLVDFADASTIPTESDVDRQILTIPAFSVVKSCDITVLETVSGGTDFDVGLTEPDGTAIDPNGLADNVVITAVGAYVAGAGALIGASTGSEDAQVTVANNGRTAGVVRIKIKYIRYND